MITQIIRIVKKEDEKKNKYYVIYFKYYNDERFTYLNKRSLDYWKNKGLKGLKIGQEINVFELENKKHFKIVWFEGLEK